MVGKEQFFVELGKYLKCLLIKGSDLELPQFVEAHLGVGGFL